MKATGSTPYRADERGQKMFFELEIYPAKEDERKTSDNMGGNAEEIAFRPMHVKPFYVCRMKGFLFREEIER